MILQAVASVKFSVESVVELLVSTYENHFDQSRTLGEDMACCEMEIAINGPNLAHCTEIIKDAMDRYWRREKSKTSWHFVKTGNTGINEYGNKSKVLQQIASTGSKFPFMDNKRD